MRNGIINAAMAVIGLTAVDASAATVIDYDGFASYVEGSGFVFEGPSPSLNFYYGTFLYEEDGYRIEFEGDDIVGEPGPDFISVDGQLAYLQDAPSGFEGVYSHTITRLDGGTFGLTAILPRSAESHTLGELIGNAGRFEGDYWAWGITFEDWKITGRTADGETVTSNFSSWDEIEQKSFFKGPRDNLDLIFEQDAAADDVLDIEDFGPGFENLLSLTLELGGLPGKFECHPSNFTRVPDRFDFERFCEEGPEGFDYTISIQDQALTPQNWNNSSSLDALILSDGQEVPVQIPVPVSALLLGTGLTTLALSRRRRITACESL